MAGSRGGGGARRLLTVRNVLVGAGLVALAVGAAFIFLPGAVPGSLRVVIDDLVAAAGPALLSALVALVVGLYAVYRLWRAAGSESVDGDGRFRGADTGSQRSGPAALQPRDRRTGSDVDSTLAWAAASTTGDAHPSHVGHAKTRLRSVLLDVLEHSGEVDDPEQAIATGTWTDDTVAAVFLGDPDEPALPDLSLWQRLYGWLYPTQAFRAHYEQTLAAVESRCAAAVSGYEPPAQVEEDAVDATAGFDPVGGEDGEGGARPQEVQG
ncbi:hypothetical protein [Haloarchaeobius sp. HME9146]|uniref:DUF7269 family protein n=1 Tax=Haloarchaeobius sp. HME9146 TaxID=2978732 RepID=UPI0021C25260|nr:hypothetical protein [Haloarchaeobius sp. HME9146]MCT9098505.1 hypothetical protein [Haloarchaeobius sp. HME9146]